MTSEATTELPPGEVLELARRFFTGSDAVHEASISEESDSHITFATFRSRLVVAAFPDPDDADATRVRVSTLREYAVVDRFLTYLESAAPERVERSAPRGLPS